MGKTTLVKEILRRYADRGLYLNCDEPDIRDALTHRTSTELRALMGRRNLVVIDEAQRVRDIGLALKLLADTYPDLQMIATGSSSFELSNTVSEPLTGRKSRVLSVPAVGRRTADAGDAAGGQPPAGAPPALRHLPRRGR